MASFDVRLASPTSFPFDPRNEQMRTTKVLPAGRVFGSHKRDQSRLLSLPDEILWQITELVAKLEKGRFLSQFALVHRECRQLARPHQFADIFITRSENSWEFLRHVIREAKHDESEPAGWSPGPFIGACIRSLSITVDEELVVDYGCSTDEEYDQWCEHWQGLMDDLTQAVESVMLNLERVYWRDTAGLEVQPRLLRVILQHSSSGRLHELALTGYKFLFEELDHVVAIMPPHPIRLRSFALGDDEGWVTNACDPCIEYLNENILRRCAPTLESFIWNADFDSKLTVENADDIPLGFRDGPIEFPKLRKFWAGMTSFGDMHPSILKCFLAASLESFSPSALLSSMMMDNNFIDKFPLPHLRTFAISGLDINRADLIDYVEQVFSLASHYAQQIEELFIYLLGGVDQLVSHISGDNFCNIRSLCFSWVHDPELRILKAIGLSLVTLDELSFGFQPEINRSQWPDVTWDSPGCPSHNDIIAAISPLKKLARLAVFGDEYIADWCGKDWAWHRFFKEFVWFNQGRGFCRPVPGQSCAKRGWGHDRPGDKVGDWGWGTRWLTDEAEDPRSAVVEVAEKYAAALPSLQGFICGRVFLEITGRGQS